MAPRLRRALRVVSRGLAAGAVLLLLVWAGLRLYDRPPRPPGGWLVRVGLEERFATVAGVRVRYIRTGVGPPVVLLHGFGSSIYTWKDVIPGLARAHETVALDLPGFGWSDQPADLSFELYPRVVLGLLDQLSLDRVSLVGNSMGGAVACWVTASEPHRVERLVLIDSAGFNLREADRPAMVRLTSHPLAEAVVGRLSATRLLVTIGLRRVFHDDTRLTEERVDEYLAAAKRPGTLRSIRSLMTSYQGTAGEFEAQLGRIKAPTLVIWGEEDEWIPPAHADRFVGAIPGARKVVLPRVGHLPEEEAPEEVTRLLIDFSKIGDQDR
jgi:pimeloyl-ACP methyl ester carboxylesterase